LRQLHFAWPKRKTLAERLAKMSWNGTSRSLAVRIRFYKRAIVAYIQRQRGDGESGVGTTGEVASARARLISGFDGGVMRRLLLVVMAGLALICASAFRISAQDFKSEKQMMKARQKAEQNAVKMKQKFAKDSLKRQEGPKAQRLLVKHQMERERRELRERQKDEIQDLKDRQRMLKEYQERL
jgi:uncharacterized protein HemX